jgi:dihydrofolate synthase/folylpolyglutamate synthase
MDYRQTIQYLYDNLPMFHRIGSAALKNDLSNSLALDNAFGLPHKKYKTIHVAGTNGKGSVSHLLAAILQSAGYKTGLFTSPHLKDFRERIRVNGNMITEEAVVCFVEKFIEMNRELNLQSSFFELTAAMALDHFRNEKVDIAVIEVGLGGRLDSTNIITPELSIITNISFDHTAILGNTLEKIATEKAGIIKPTVPVVVGEYQPETANVFIKTAKQQKATIVFADQDFSLVADENGNLSFSTQNSFLYQNVISGLKGNYQQKNFLTVITSLEIMKKQWQITDEAVKNGFAHVVELTGLLGRWQQLGEKPKIICDTGHNEAGIRWVTAQLRKEKFEKLHIVFGVVNDKDVNSILPLLPTPATYYFTKAAIERALDEKILQEKAADFGLKGVTFPTVAQAFDAAKKDASENDLIFVGGSTFVVAELM